MENKTKICNICKIEYPATLDYFYKSRNSLYPHCKNCFKQIAKKWRQENKEKHKKLNKIWKENNLKRYKETHNQINKKWRERNREKYNQTAKKCYSKHREKYNQISLKQAKDNPEKHCAKSARRRAMKLQVTLNGQGIQEGLEKFYLNCPPGYEVDHIIPMAGKIAQGFHVPWNLQYLTIKENRAKGNKFESYIEVLLW